MDEKPQVPPEYQPLDGGINDDAPLQHADDITVSWSASEFIHHAKGIGWYSVFAIAMLIIIGVSILVHAWTFILLAVVMAIALTVVSIRPPQILHYELSSLGLRIDQKFYGLEEFRAFGVVSEGAFFSIELIPVKRFMPTVTIYFEEKDGEKIVDILGARMPMQQIEPDLVDRIMRIIRF